MQRKSRFSGSTSIENPTVTISITIPGTFTTPLATQPAFQGRVISKIIIFFGAPIAGDYCNSVVVSDSNGVIPVPIRGNFPNYPIVYSFADAALSGGSAGFYLPVNKPMEFIPSQNSGIIPSGLVLIATFTKGSASADTIYIDMDWDDLT